jgi:hypothetical protein
MTVVNVPGSVDELADGMGGSLDAVTGAAISRYRKSRFSRRDSHADPGAVATQLSSSTETATSPDRLLLVLDAESSTVYFPLLSGTLSQGEVAHVSASETSTLPIDALAQSIPLLPSEGSVRPLGRSTRPAHASGTHALRRDNELRPVQTAGRSVNPVSHRAQPQTPLPRTGCGQRQR